MTEEFVVDIKDSTVEQNEAAAEYRAEVDNPVRFDSRSDAEATARRLDREGTTSVRLQSIAPQDPRDVDAYLVPMPRDDPREPIESSEGTWRFNVTANQYGALGEALVGTFSRDPPPLVPFIREEVDEFLSRVSHVEYDSVDEFDLRVRLDRNPRVVTLDEDDERLQWRPDVVAEAWVGYTGRLLRRYWCEIKTGNASLERDQRRVMEAKAETATVLQVRFDVDDLPKRYTVHVSEVEP